MIKRTLLSIAILAITLGVAAQNPVICDRYTPDPAPYVHGETLYLFVDHDEDQTENGYFTMKDWLLYSTEDMVNWTYRGTPLTSATFSSWAKQDNDCWASQCIERNGKWYWYVTATIKGQAYPGIGVAVADSPAGPYRDPIGRPLVQGWYKIDPSVFIDDDKQAYLFYGNNMLWYARLNEDMVSINGGENEVMTKSESAFGPFKGYDDNGNPKTNFEEASWIYKRNGKYYLEYAAGGVPEYMAYSTADNITGPWTYRGKIMNQAENSFTIHGGSVEFKGHHYMFYHNGKLPGGGGFKRATCVEEFTPNADGSIPFISFTSNGVNPIQTLNPFANQEAETINQCEGVRCEGDHNGCYVTNISNGDYIKVRNVEFGNQGAKSFFARIRSTQAGTLVIRTGSRTGDVKGQVAVESTGGQWTEVSCNLTSPITGTNDLYFTFEGNGQSIFDFDSWRFDKTQSLSSTFQNPVIFADFPDPDVIRVDDTYYMISTTMHHFPGATIVKSTDLVHWEYCAHPLTQLANTDRYNLLNGQNAYASGMWACSMKYHNGKFYILINGNDAGGWLLTATNPEGEWEKRKLARGYYDPGMLFDNGKVYVACGIGNIQMCELDENFNYIREVNVISDKSGLEGCHLYKRGNYYYIYATYGGWPSGQVVFRSQNIFGPYEEKMLVEKYINNSPNTIHQGALFDTPTGEWWTIMQQDLGCLGRMPNLQPVNWVNDWPIVGNNGIPYTTYSNPVTSRPMASRPLPTTDQFSSSSIGMQWEWNHNPDNNAWSLSERPGWLRLKTSGVADRLTQARNMLTQRIFAFHNEPNTPSTGTVRIDVSNLQEGDRAGICILQDPYAFLAVEKKNGQLRLLWRQDQLTTNNNFSPAEEVMNISNDVIYLRAAVTYGSSLTQFSYSLDNKSFTNIGGQTRLGYNLSIFVGARFGLFCYATEGGHAGYADFDWFESNVKYDELGAYELGDDIVNYAPTVWTGQTGEFGGLGHTSYERYNFGSLGVGDVLTQTLTGVKNGTYNVTLELAGSYTSGRGFECPTGTGLSQAFANDQFLDLEIVDRDWVSNIEPMTISCAVTNNTLKYGIYNIANSGNWYVANVTSIEYVSENTDNTFKVNTSAQHGTLTCSASKAAAGTTVTLSATPDANYEFDSFTVTTCTGETVAVNGSSFVMPSADVAVTANFSLAYEVGDDIVAIAPTEWVGQTGIFGGTVNDHTVSERYNNFGSIDAGDVLTQTLSGLKNGIYTVTLEVAATFTSGRGFECPTGDGLTVAFANNSQKNLEVVDRNWVSSVTPITIYATVTDGTLKYGIHNLKASGNWYVANVTSIKYISESTTLTHELTIPSTGLSTLYLPFDAEIPDADFFVVVAVKEISGTTAHLKEVHDIIPAKTGVMIYANEGTYTLPLATTSSTENVVSLLHGVLEDTPVETLIAQEGKSIYVLSRGIKEYIGFKRVVANGAVTTIPANKAYLPFSASSHVNSLNVSFEDSTTDINRLMISTQEDSDEIYDLIGRKVTAPQKGIYIVNGKKYLIR